MPRKKNPPHPMQPIVLENKVARFKKNAIVRFLLDFCTTSNGPNMNTLAMMEFSQEDREQFLQLIGYSVSGFGELSCVRKKSIEVADKIVEEMVAKKK